VTVDGGSILAVGSFGSHMGFSQDLVQEFQISAANFDLSTGATDAGAVNIVTRSGGNAFHGTTFYFFRDHTLSPRIPAFHAILTAIERMRGWKGGCRNRPREEL
jgi:hypothetical protein